MMGEKSAEVPMPRELASLAKQKVVWYTKRNRERKRVWDMENTFRSAIFGGFNRQDVMEYISRMASDHKESLEKFEQENADLRTQLEGKSELERALEDLRRDYENIAQELAEEKIAKEQYRRQLEESTAQVKQMAEFQREAEEYSGVKEHIADIELEARRRADDVLAEAKSQADALLVESEQKVKELRRSTAEELRELYDQYQRLTGAFQTAATHVTEELRRMDVAVGQLPLSFDKTRSKLEKLKEQL